MVKAKTGKLKDLVDDICSEVKTDMQDVDIDEKDVGKFLIEKSKKMADKILDNGDPIKYIMKTVEKSHVGEFKTIEGMCISIAGQSCTNTDGIQISVNGSSGSGKSHGMKTILHLVPKRYKRMTSMSAKALYYMKLKPGMIIFSDDSIIDDELAQVFKQSTTNYQEYTFRTVVKDMVGMVNEIPPRINTYFTSVENNVSDQVLNRQLIFETDTSPKQKNKIFEMQQKDAITGYNKVDVDLRVLISRRIFSDIKDKLFKVRIPFADRIGLIDKSNSRVFTLLCDMIKGYAVFRYRQRMIDNDGYLLAEVDDYKKAKILFTSRVENTVTKLTKTETDIIAYIVKNQNKVNEKGCTVNEIAKGTQMSYITITRLISGRKDNTESSGGLLSKVKELKKDDSTEMIYEKDDDGNVLGSKGRRAERFYIEDYNPFDLFKQDFITLKED